MRSACARSFRTRHEGDGEEMFLNARRMFLDRLTKGDNAADVEPFVVTQFNSQLTLFQNIVFGAVSSPEMLPNEFPADSPLWELLAIDGLDRQLYQLGRDASAVIVDLFGEVSDNIKILERLDLIDPTKLPDYSAALGRTERRRLRERGDGGPAEVHPCRAELQRAPPPTGSPHRGIARRHRQGAHDLPREAAGRIWPRNFPSTIRTRSTRSPRCRTTYCSAASSTGGPARSTASALFCAKSSRNSASPMPFLSAG